MSNFTTQLRYICESFAGYEENQAASKVNDVISAARPYIFDFDYPHAELTASEKEHLEKHILLHFYMQEIGQETMGAFKYFLQSKLWDIMPKYEQLYYSTHLDLDFFRDVDYTRKLDSTTTDDDKAVKTGSISRAGTGYDERTKTGSIVTDNTGTTENVKSGSEKTENGGYTESTQTGSVKTENDTTVTTSENGSYKDTESGQINKVTTGSYTDSSENGSLQLTSDTPQSQVNIETNDYVSNINKNTGDSKTTRVYNNLMESTQPVAHATERTFTNRSTDNVTDGEQTQTFNNVKNKTEDATESTTTFNNIKDKRTDSLKTEQSFNNYKDRFDDHKTATETYNSLMDKIDNENIVDLTERVYGNVTGNNIRKLKEYRENIINIEMMIIKDLRPLFFGLYM